MFESLSYQNGVLCLDGVSLQDIANEYGSPCYVYSRNSVEQQWLAYDSAFGEHPHLVCYAVKANSNIAILNVLAKLGSGFDIVSIGELERVRKAGGDVNKVVFSGVGKTEQEMKLALEYGVKCFNVESIAELHRLNSVAGSINKIAPVSLRINPDVDANTHPYISTGLRENKFGIAYDEAVKAYELANSLEHLEIVGVDCHIGSQITEISPFIDALKRLVELINKLSSKGIQLKHVDIGGGLGIQYQDETIPEMSSYAKAIIETLNDENMEVLIEPGRSIVGNAGVLVTKVEYIKQGEDRNFAIVDAAMNDLLRPSLYSAYHEILTVNENSNTKQAEYDIVGPICETGDFLGKARKLAIQQDDLIAVCSAGAYGFTMASNYNTRPRVAEIMISEGLPRLIRRRETIEELFEHEVLLP